MTERSIDHEAALLMRGVEFGNEQIRTQMERELRARLTEARRKQRPLRVYCGYDPTAPDLHLGHTVTMRKLRQFQELGHEVTFLIGTFTSLIGDPSDHDRARPRQSPGEAKANAQTYVEQAFRILDPDRTLVRYNGDWLSKLTFADVMELASHFTVQQFLQRDNFARRHAKAAPIWLHEFFYALMQAYDAVHMKTDVQIGATEQLFNLLAGRKLQEARGLRPQICLTLPILVGTDGRQRMSKSMGNYIGIAEPPAEIYGKVMSLPDSAMLNYAELVTRWVPEEVASFKDDLVTGRVHPRELKMRLAWEITTSLCGDDAADAAQSRFRRVFQHRGLPDDMPEYPLAEGANVVDLLKQTGLVSSTSEGRRLVQQGGVSLDGEKIDEIELHIELREAAVLRAGRRRFVRLVPG